MFHLIVGWFTLVAEVHKRAATCWTYLRQVSSLVCEQRDQEAEGEWGEESEREGWKGEREMGGKESEREGRAGEREKGRVRKNAS